MDETATSSTKEKDPAVQPIVASDVRLLEAIARETKRLADLSERRLELEQLNTALHLFRFEIDLRRSGPSNHFNRCESCGENRLSNIVQRDTQERFFRLCEGCKFKSPYGPFNEVQKSAIQFVARYRFPTGNSNNK
jgi:hypothetical protein